jgi:hypothetical protein
MMKAALMMFAGMAVAFAAKACHPVQAEVEQAIEGELHQILGPAMSYKVRLSDVDLFEGRAESMSVIGSRVHPKDVPPLDRIEIDLHHIGYDRKTGSVERIGSVQARIWVRMDDLAAYLRDERGIEAATLGFFPPDEAFLQVPVEQASARGVSVGDLRLSGRLEGQETRVVLNVVDVLAEGLGNSGALAEEIASRLNPIIDLSKLPIPLEVQTVAVIGDRISITATGSYPRS